MEPVGLVGAVRNEVAAELASWRLDGDIDLTLGRLDTAGEELEVVDKCLHGLINSGPGRWRDLGVLDSVVASRHALDDLPDDSNRLPDLVQAHGVPVEGVTDRADDDVEVDLVVVEVRHGLAKVPR